MITKDSCTLAIKTLRQDEPALLRLRDDENGEQCPIGLIEVEGEGNEQGEEARGGGLGREYRSDPSRGRAFALVLRMMISAFRRRILSVVIGWAAVLHRRRSAADGITVDLSGRDVVAGRLRRRGSA